MHWVAHVSITMNTCLFSNKHINTVLLLKLSPAQKMCINLQQKIVPTNVLFTPV